MPAGSSNRWTLKCVCTVRFKGVVIGLSSGGVEMLLRVLPALPANFALPVIVCLHIGQDASGLAALLNDRAALHVKEAEALELAVGGTIYIAPAGYHLLVEGDHRFSLSADAPVKYARPAIDVLFESAADAYGPGLIGVILTGASDDGAAGLLRVRARGGYAVIQSPESAAASMMPASALCTAGADQLVTPDELVPLLLRLTTQET